MVRGGSIVSNVSGLKKRGRKSKIFDIEDGEKNSHNKLRNEILNAF
jgi:hypothetical protein